MAVNYLIVPSLVLFIGGVIVFSQSLNRVSDWGVALTFIGWLIAAAGVCLFAAWWLSP